MIDLKSGRFSWGEGYALWPGMTRKEFEASALYRDELPEAVKQEPEKFICALKTQNIDGFTVDIMLGFDQDNYLRRVSIAHPDNYTWNDWPPERDQHEHLRFIKDYNDRFLATQIRGSIEGGRELSFDFEWGTISSSCSYVHFPEAEINIRFDTFYFKPGYTEREAQQLLDRKI